MVPIAGCYLALYPAHGDHLFDCGIVTVCVSIGGRSMLNPPRLVGIEID